MRFPTAHRRARQTVLLLVCIGACPFGHAGQVRHGDLQIDVVRDRLTLSMTGHPQVYLHGEIDAEAPRRFEALMRSGRVPAGSDIYLNSRTGDLDAGMALGRLFRGAGMATHLGTPRPYKDARAATKTAVCLDACAYAYLGGLYRWAPSGSDRIGFSIPPATGGPAAAGVQGYLAQMGIDPKALADAAAPLAAGHAWMNPGQMIKSRLANNGKLKLTVSASLSAPAPTIELRQVGRKGTRRLTIQCRPGSTVVAAIDEVGATRARQIAARGARSYFQLGEKPVLSQARDGAVAEGDALVIRRSYPPGDLGALVSAWSFGAWVDGRSSAFRDGFSLPTHQVYQQLADYFQACWHAAPWPSGQEKKGAIVQSGTAGTTRPQPRGR